MTTAANRHSLQDKHILLAVSGGIAAYKSAYLIRLLIKAGAQVRVLMSETAKAFITPLTLATLSKNPILVDFYDPENGDWNSHVDIGLWADAYVVAPATANTLAKMVAGIADNLLLITYLSARCPVFLAPTMDLDMYAHPATQNNLRVLSQRGHYLIEPESGELASGLEGKGRMAEPENITDCLARFFAGNRPLSGKQIMVTAGPTYENIDPVRFIGNYSSGKMGYAIAEALAEAGAKVLLISGPVAIELDKAGIDIQKVVSAQDMYEACIAHFEQCDAAVMAAAVADYTPKGKANQKLKRQSKEMTLTLKSTRDIAATLGQQKRDDQLLVGFALESEDAIEHAQKKLVKKNLDLIVFNSLSEAGAGFNHDTNKVSLIDRDNNIQKFELKSKREVARDIVERMIAMISK